MRNFVHFLTWPLSAREVLPDAADGDAANPESRHRRNREVISAESLSLKSPRRPNSTSQTYFDRTSESLTKWLIFSATLYHHFIPL